MGLHLQECFCPTHFSLSGTCYRPLWESSVQSQALCPFALRSAPLQVFMNLNWASEFCKSHILLGRTRFTSDTRSTTRSQSSIRLRLVLIHSGLGTWSILYPSSCPIWWFEILQDCLTCFFQCFQKGWYLDRHHLISSTFPHQRVQVYTCPN